jgi:hypothetical protein
MIERPQAILEPRIESNIKSCLTYIKEISKIKNGLFSGLSQDTLQGAICSIGEDLRSLLALTTACIISSAIFGSLGPWTVVGVAFNEPTILAHVFDRAFNTSSIKEYFSNLMSNDIVQKVTERTISTKHLAPLATFAAIITTGVIIGKYCTRENVRREENAAEPVALVR